MTDRDLNDASMLLPKERELLLVVVADGVCGAPPPLRPDADAMLARRPDGPLATDNRRAAPPPPPPTRVDGVASASTPGRGITISRRTLAPDAESHEALRGMEEGAV